ncbi:hypothetical protein EDD85DRAFT_958802 [Armillaria nabsnona]|nr:hypothetical protein EDD85DRAFT_958802 [Armillaria nabsnona]
MAKDNDVGWVGTWFGAGGFLFCISIPDHLNLLQAIDNHNNGITLALGGQSFLTLFLFDRETGKNTDYTSNRPL